MQSQFKSCPKCNKNMILNKKEDKYICVFCGHIENDDIASFLKGFKK